MTINSFFLTSPFFWVLFAAFFTSAGIKRAIHPVRDARDTRDYERAVNRKWVEVCVFFSCALVVGMCAFFIPGAKELAQIKYLYVYLIFVIIIFFCLRFKRVFGIPCFFLFMFTLLFLILFVRSLTPYTGDTEIARVHVLAQKEHELVMELELPEDNVNILKMKGDSFVPVIKVIMVDDILLFLGAKTWYRFIGMATYIPEQGSEIPSRAETFEIESPTGISKELYRFVQTYETYIPGIKSVQGEIVLKKAQPMTSYSVHVRNDGGVFVEIIK